jgi:flagellar biosynthesis protein FlhG
MDLYLGVGPELAPRVLAEMRNFRARIVVNQVRAKTDLDLGPALASAARRRLGIPVDYLGHLEHDDAVWLAVRKRRPLFVEHPESRAAKCIERIARRLLAIENEKPTPHEPKPMPELNHYEILEVEPAATDEEIRRAVRRIREVYAPDSLVLPGLYNRERLAALHARIDEAYETLIDEERRRVYDQSIFPDGQVPRPRGASAPGVPSTIPPGSVPGERSGPIQLIDEPGSSGPHVPVPPAAPRPPEPPIGTATEFTGALLKQLREARGIDLHAIAQRTKITVAHLRAIEEETLKALPAMVYVRGFLVEYARFMRLDVTRVVETYLARLKALRGKWHSEDES